MRALRVYADTCVFGGALDNEFHLPTRQFFDEVRRGSFHLIVSALVRDELGEAPSQVTELFGEMLEWTTVVPISADALDLQQAYLDAGILTPRWADDALHVAMATVTDCSLIVSWNFKHIVHFEKIPQYNAMNAKYGCRPLAIYSPLEVLHYDNEEEF